MNTLLVSVSCPPKNSPESFQTGRYLQYLKKWNRISVVTTRVTGGWEPADASLLKYLEGTDQVIALRTPHPRIISVIRKLAPSFLFPDESLFFPRQYKRILKQVAKPEVLFSRSAPFSSSMMALKLANHWGVPWIAHFSDPWADSPFLKNDVGLRGRHDALERQCVSRAQLVTLTSKKTVSFYQQKYPAWHSKFRFLPNVFDEADVTETSVSFESKMKFVFTGRLYGSRSVHSFMDAIERAMQLRPELINQVEFIFAGFFVDESINRLKQSPLNNVRFAGALSMEEAMALQRSAAVLLAIDSIEKDPMFDLFFPSKLLDYMAARRPIIAITGSHSTTHDVVEGKFGKCFDQTNLMQLPTHIIYCIDQYLARNADFFNNSSEFMEYSAQRNAERLQQFFNEVTRGHE